MCGCILQSNIVFNLSTRYGTLKNNSSLSHNLVVMPTSMLHLSLVMECRVLEVACDHFKFRSAGDDASVLHLLFGGNVFVACSRF